jgi:hypothetical protein
LAVQPIIDGAQLVGGRLDVGDSQMVEQSRGVFVRRIDARLDRRVIAAAADGFLKNRRVGGDAAQSIVFNQRLQTAVLEHVAADKVQPCRLAGAREGLQRMAHGWSSRFARLESPRDAPTARKISSRRRERRALTTPERRTRAKAHSRPCIKASVHLFVIRRGAFRAENHYLET